MEDRKQVKSKKRVAEHGEVFTNQREIDAMMNLISCETNRLESRFLEPACGDGNFLIEILKRKMEIVNNKSKDTFEWKRNSAVVFSSIYGIELLDDNAEECRCRLFDFFYNNYYRKKIKVVDDRFLKVIRFFLKTNILCGDALSLRAKDDSPLIFAERGWVGEKVQRRDFALSGLINDSKQSYIDESKKNNNNGQMSLFESAPEVDFENAGLIKERKYKLIYFFELGDYL